MFFSFNQSDKQYSVDRSFYGEYFHPSCLEIVKIPARILPIFVSCGTREKLRMDFSWLSHASRRDFPWFLILYPQFLASREYEIHRTFAAGVLYWQFYAEHFSTLDKLLGQLGNYATWLFSIAYLQKQLRIFIYFLRHVFGSDYTRFLIEWSHRECAYILTLIVCLSEYQTSGFLSYLNQISSPCWH